MIHPKAKRSLLEFASAFFFYTYHQASWEQSQVTQKMVGELVLKYRSPP